MGMSCFNCGYAYHHYYKGTCDGVDCAKHNLTFIPASEILERGACPAWIEGDENDD